MKRIGHKGADLIAPGNTPASFDAAIAAGVDGIEFDVLAEDPKQPETTRLLLAHDHGHPLDEAASLADGLTHLASPAFAGVDLIVDLKLPGYEPRVVDALRKAGLLERATAATLFMRSLVRIREIEPSLRLSWSVPRVRRDYTASPLYALPAYALLTRLRRRFPRVAAEHLRARRCDAITAHWRLVTPQLVAAVHGEGGELYVWTVDDREQISQLEALGVDGVITNDPRLFGPAQEIRQVAAL